jgi:hypothetical protein
MLFSSHWEKAIYHNALFLDWLSVYSSQHDNQYFENIVIDYQSAIAIEDEQRPPIKIPVSPVLQQNLREDQLLHCAVPQKVSSASGSIKRELAEDVVSTFVGIYIYEFD